MRNKVMFITTSIISVIFLTFFITSLALAGKIDVNDELDRLVNYVNENAGPNDFASYLKTAQNRIDSVYSLSYFAFGYEGYGGIRSIHSSQFTMFSLSWNFIVPIFGIILTLLVIVWITKFFVERIRRSFKAEITKLVGKLGFYISGSLLLLFLLVGLSLISATENSFRATEIIKIWGEDGKGVGNPDAFSFLTIVQFGSLNGLSSVLKGDLGYVAPFISAGFKDNELVAATTFLVVLVPMTSIAMIGFFGVYAGVFISAQRGSVSNFANWTQNIRIDSRKEYNRAIFTNPYVWLLSILYIATIIFPGLVHPYANSSQTALAIVATVLMPFGFSPMVIGIIKVKMMQPFNYNLLMWIQIVTLWFMGTVFQLTVFVLMKESINAHSGVSSLWPFFAIVLSTSAMYGFIRYNKR